MAFGNNYAPQEMTPPLELGEYKARIKGASVEHYNNGNEYCRVMVEISGHPDCQPNSFILNETPALGAFKTNGTMVTEKDVNIANAFQTRFFDAFGIVRGDFNLTHWIGKTGYVKCSQQKNSEYRQLSPILKETKKTGPQPAPLPPPAQYQQPMEAMPFQEDVF